MLLIQQQKQTKTKCKYTSIISDWLEVEPNSAINTTKISPIHCVSEFKKKRIVCDARGSTSYACNWRVEQFSIRWVHCNFPFTCSSVETNAKKFRNREFTFAISRLAVSAAFGIFENCFWISCVPFLVSVTLSHSVRWHCSSCSESKWEIDTEIENEKNEKSGQDEACKHSAYIQHRDSRCNNFFGKSPRFPVMGLIVLPLFVA